jgi:tetratricopeptide (TPR) repeat protein
MNRKLLGLFYGCILLLGAIAFAADDPLVTIDPKYNQAVLDHPDDPRSFFNRANAWLEQQQYQHALEDYNSALVINPEFANALFNRGFTRRMLKQYDLALLDYNAVLLLNPDDVDALNNRAIIECLMRNYFQAQNDLTRALQIDPENFHVQRNLDFLKEAQAQRETAIQRDDQLDLEDSYIRFGNE